ncbi:V-type ATPase subunit [Demequina maris]|uniref:V-type ATPase subunit n=1 Tax=Demequina maris TaxID=1638982 RepID=UPI000782651D|nr:V-type ATPase subunit [Demequina maris]
MSAAWVGATVRVRALAAGRAGPQGAVKLAAAPTLDEAAELMRTWSYGARIEGPSTPEALQRAARETLLWQLRVLAGWAPAGGTRLMRAAAADFERANILMRMRELRSGARERPYDLGAMETSWTLLSGAEGPDEMRSLLARSAWGEVPDEDEAQLADILAAASLERRASASPAARTWAARGAALLAARIVAVDRTVPAAVLRRRLRLLLGGGWERADDLGSLAAALPGRVATVLDGVDGPHDLWRAESRHHALIEAEAAAQLRAGTARSEVVVAGIALLDVDAWRVQAAVAAVGSGRAGSEVLDAAA